MDSQTDWNKATIPPMLTLYIFAAIVLARVEIASAAPQFADAHLEQSVREELC